MFDDDDDDDDDDDINFCVASNYSYLYDSTEKAETHRPLQKVRKGTGRTKCSPFAS
jgi:hypothetical protein